MWATFYNNGLIVCNCSKQWNDFSAHDNRATIFFYGNSTNSETGRYDLKQLFDVLQTRTHLSFIWCLQSIKKMIWNKKIYAYFIKFEFLSPKEQILADLDFKLLSALLFLINRTAIPQQSVFCIHCKEVRKK